ncbi:MAG: alpha/beta hydrolase [Gemmatimonadota bacterium]|nr:alpha/beta hydrolase [Gemmatimonadota bacterium]MDH3424432.1 alpha/beta hydrolase [Gemmatimonadota bacterium]
MRRGPGRRCIGLCAAMLVFLGAAEAEGQTARQGLLTLEDARLFYEIVGSGEPIIVIHGGPGLDHAYLRPGLDALAARNTLVYYDQRGTGRSSAELTESVIDFDAFVDDVDALRQALGYERVSVLGHSFGTLIALEYARRYPDRSRALILMNPVEPGSRHAEETARRLAERTPADVTAEMGEIRATEAFAARDPATLSRFYRLAFRRIVRDATVIDLLSLDLASTTARQGQDVARLLGTSLGTVEWWDRLTAIGTPTLIIAGRHDAPPLAMGRELAEALPMGTFEALDSGHFPYVEDRPGLLSAVSSFFATLR